MNINPFPGPQPYRASDRDRFFGRDDLSHRLQSSIGANRCVTVYGPSGAGKSSMLQASVLPNLVESNEVRVVRVDAWPERQDPTLWLAIALHAELRYGEIPADIAPIEIVTSSLKRAARSSSRLVVLILDQLEQLIYAERDPSTGNAFFECIDEVVNLPVRIVRVVLSLREDYFGRLRERLRGREQLLTHAFRVGPLTVAELTEAVCQSAKTGAPPQTWSTEEMRRLMLQVRIPGAAETDEAEAQSAYAQIVCRALFEQRAGNRGDDGEAGEAEPILHQYLDATLEGLGELRDAAERLLEEHLVTADGGRALRTERELLEIVSPSDLSRILGALEGAAILHAEEHHGGRYFEIGHDWLARKVFERRKTRQDEQSAREHAEALAREVAKGREQRANMKELWWLHEEQRRALAKARKQRRALVAFAAACTTATLVSASVAVHAWKLKRAADGVIQEAEQRMTPSRCASAPPRRE